MNFRQKIALLSAFALSCSVLSGFPDGAFDMLNVNAADTVLINETNFPDEIFRNYLQENFDTDSSGGFSESEIANIKNIDIESSEISSIRGIEFFTSLTKLDTFNNPITTMDLSKNTKLKTLTCSSNELTQLDVSNNTSLTYLSCASNSLTALDVSKNTLLEDLYCYSNSLTSLDVSKNTLLDTLYCNSNQLTKLNLNNNTKLKSLDCSSNQLTSLDLSNCTAIGYLECQVNQIASLDVSNLSDLYYFKCYSNQLTELNLTNNAKLQSLDCKNNQIASLNLTNCTILTTIYCNDNLLTALDLSKSTLLETLYCDDNQLTSLDLSNNTLLKSLRCAYNKISRLNISNCAALETLSCYKNELTAIDVTCNTKLEYLDCAFNSIQVLDISNCTMLQTLFCSDNQLTSLDTSNSANLSAVYCATNEYDIGKIGANTKTFDLSNLPGDFDPAKTSNWQGAVYENGMLTNIEGVNGYTVKYTYDIGNGMTREFTLSFAYYGEVTFDYLSFDDDEETYFADNTEDAIHHYAYLHYTFPELEEGTFAMLITDFCDITKIVSPDSSLDVANTSSSSATEEYVSPFDLYWSARNAGITECEFVYTYRMDMSKIDALFNRINARTGYDLSYQENFDLFVNILYDENGNALDLATQTVNIVQRGDANLDHAVDTKDAALIAKYQSELAAGSSTPMLNAENNELALFAADFNSDSSTDTKDAANCAKFASIYATNTSTSVAKAYYAIMTEMGILS